MKALLRCQLLDLARISARWRSKVSAYPAVVDMAVHPSGTGWVCDCGL